MEQFSIRRQVLYANGHLGFSILDNLFGVYLIFFLIPPKELGMPELVSNEPVILGLTVLGLAIIFGRVVDSLADPLVAFWTDNARFRMGRRKFFLVTGAVPFALASALLFFPPEHAVGPVNAWYIAAMLGVYFFFYTYYMTPNLALIPELSRTHQQRIRITIFQALFSILGAAVVMLIVPIIWEVFVGTGMERSGAFQLSVVILTAVAAVSMLLSAAPVDEKRFSKTTPAGIGLIESVKRTVSNRNFLVYMVGTIAYWFGFNVIRATIAYYPVVLLGQPPAFQSILMAVLFGAAVVVFLLLPVLSARFTNKQLMAAGMVSFAVLMTFTAFVDLLGSWAVPAAMIQLGLMGFPVAILLVVPNAAVSDISEVDGHRTGMNREAMFFGTQGLFMKVNYGIAAAITASLFSFFGKDVSEPLGVKLAGPVGAAFVLIGLVIFLRYPQKAINAELAEIRESLAE